MLSNLNFKPRPTARNSQPSDGARKYLTPAEAAAHLRVSAKTLANWRSNGTGPTYKKVGSRVVYDRPVVMDYGAEIQGLGQKKPSKVTITVRPYPRDPNRQQVDIMIQHPATQQIVRRRLTAPKGMDAAAAKSWGDAQVKGILRGLFIAPVGSEEKEEKATRKLKPVDDVDMPTIGQLWTEYETHTLIHSKPRNQATASGHWRQLAPIVGHVRADGIDVKIIRKLEARFKDSSAVYLQHVMMILGHLLKIAKAAGHIAVIPELPKRKKEKKVREIAHSTEEVNTLLETARSREMGDRFPGENLALVLLLGLDAGLRPGEVAGLRWSDIDWRANQLIVQNQRPAAGNSDTSVKTGEAGRVTMSLRLRRELEEHRHNGGHYVIVNGEGEPLYTTRIGFRVSEVHKAAGMKARCGHFLRHVSASRVILAGGDVAMAQAHLRHKHATTTQTYIHDVRGSVAGASAAALLDDLDNQPERGLVGNRLATRGNTDQSSRLSLN